MSKMLTIEDLSQDVVDYLETHGEATEQELADVLGVSTRAVQRRLRHLKERGKLFVEGFNPRSYVLDNPLQKPEKLQQNVVGYNYRHVMVIRPWRS